MRIDHVIFATADLDAAATRIESELGLTVLPGGRHEGLGTHNRIVPLGGGYLELMAVFDPEAASSSELAGALQAGLTQRVEGLLAWSIAVDDVEPIAARLGTSITTVRREGLSARLTGLAAALREPFLPFFISRDHDVADPGVGNDAGGIAWVEVAGDAPRLERWLGDAELPVRVVEGEAGVRAVGIGEREFRPSQAGAGA